MPEGLLDTQLFTIRCILTLALTGVSSWALASLAYYLQKHSILANFAAAETLAKFTDENAAEALRLYNVEVTAAEQASAINKVRRRQKPPG